jgi:hypothetical protein
VPVVGSLGGAAAIGLACFLLWAWLRFRRNRVQPQCCRRQQRAERPDPAATEIAGAGDVHLQVGGGDGDRHGRGTYVPPVLPPPPAPAAALAVPAMQYHPDTIREAIQTAAADIGDGASSRVYHVTIDGVDLAVKAILGTGLLREGMVRVPPREGVTVLPLYDAYPDAEWLQDEEVFRAEVSVLSRIRHPHIVDLVGYSFSGRPVEYWVV